MGAFAEKEDLEYRYAWHKFKEWLEKGQWNYRYGRYPLELTNIDFKDPEIPRDLIWMLRMGLNKLPWKFDGIMDRAGDTWIWDLKYKRKARFKTWVDKASYRDYYRTTTELGIPFIIAAYVHEEDSLYFHRIRDPESKPSPIEFRDRKGVPVYEFPEAEYLLITGFDVPYEAPKTEVEKHAWSRKVEDLYTAFIENRPPPENNYNEQILKDMNETIIVDWSEYGVPIMDSEFPSSEAYWKHAWKEAWKAIRRQAQKASPYLTRKDKNRR